MTFSKHASAALLDRTLADGLAVMPVGPCTLRAKMESARKAIKIEATSPAFRGEASIFIPSIQKEDGAFCPATFHRLTTMLLDKIASEFINVSNSLRGKPPHPTTPWLCDPYWLPKIGDRILATFDGHLLTARWTSNATKDPAQLPPHISQRDSLHFCHWDYTHPTKGRSKPCFTGHPERYARIHEDDQ